jgi:hypothetical protein
MGMKPRLTDSALPIPGCVNQPSPVSEFGNIINAVNDLQPTQDHPLPGSVSQQRSPGTPQKFERA